MQADFDELAEQINKWSTFVLANLLWAVLSIPVITLPAATAGLFTTMSLWVRGKPPNLFVDFLGGMRRCWLTSTLIVLLDGAIGGLVVLNFTVFPIMDMQNPLAFLSRSVSLFVGLALALVNLYAWPLLVTFDLPLSRVLALALKFAAAHWVYSVGLLVVVLLPVIVSLWLPVGALVLVTFSCSIFIWNWGAWRIIRQYVADEDRAKLESPSPNR